MSLPELVFGGVFFSANSGINWTLTSLGNQAAVWSLAVNGNNVFAGTNFVGVYSSTNNGLNWTQTSLNNQTVISLAINENDVFAGTFNGVFKSSNNGMTWTQTFLNNRVVWSLAISGNNIFAGVGSSMGNGVYVSSDNGTKWLLKKEGMDITTPVRALCISNNYIFAGTWGNGVWRRPIDELVGIQPVLNEIPKEYKLLQNYPNPFNPMTNVRFQISKLGFVGLKIYDALGREITTLVNEQLNPGIYKVEWDGSNYPSGVYYYKLTVIDASTSLSTSLTDTKKMVLIK